MYSTIQFFRTEVVDKNSGKRFFIVMGIMLFFSALTVIMSYT